MLLVIFVVVVGAAARVDGFRLLKYPLIALLCLLRATLLEQSIGVVPKGIDCRDDLSQALFWPFPTHNRTSRRR